MSNYLQPHGLQHTRLLHEYIVAYFSSFKEGNLVACYSVDSPWWHYVNEINQMKTKRQILWVCSYDISKVIRFIERQSRMVTAGAQEGKRGVVVQWVENFSFTRWKVLDIYCVCVSSVMTDSLWLPGLGHQAPLSMEICYPTYIYLTSPNYILKMVKESAFLFFYLKTWKKLFRVHKNNHHVKMLIWK